jgi:uncharacterized protein YgiM (DUF1202 family)
MALWSSPRSSSRRVAILGDGDRFVVRGALVTDGSGRTWAPVVTRRGRRGYVAAWIAGFTGTARTRTDLVLRSGASTSTGRLGTVRSGVRVTILRRGSDRHDRAWLKVRTPNGRTGWVAAWLTHP